MQILSARIEALEKHVPNFRQQFMADLMRQVSIQRIDEAIKTGRPGLRALLAEVYCKKSEKLGSEAADAWALRLKEHLSESTRQGNVNR
jgi:hypothetical protein